MNLSERLEVFKVKGWSYNPTTGDISTPKGRIVNGRCGGGYINCATTVNGNSINVRGHQLAWYFVYNKVPKEVDHIDGNRANNKLNNLRIVTRQQNNFNRINTKGVSRLKKNGKWYAQIVLNGKKIHLGYFYLEEDAINAYKEAKKKYHIIDGHCYSTS